MVYPLGILPLSLLYSSEVQGVCPEEQGSGHGRHFRSPQAPPVDQELKGALHRTRETGTWLLHHCGVIFFLNCNYSSSPPHFKDILIMINNIKGHV